MLKDEILGAVVIFSHTTALMHEKKSRKTEWPMLADNCHLASVKKQQISYDEVQGAVVILNLKTASIYK